MVTRNESRSLRNEHTPDSASDIAESREEEHRFAFYKSNTRVLGLQRGLTFGLEIAGEFR